LELDCFDQGRFTFPISQGQPTAWKAM